MRWSLHNFLLVFLRFHTIHWYSNKLSSLEIMNLSQCSRPWKTTQKKKWPKNFFREFPLTLVNQVFFWQEIRSISIHRTSDTYIERQATDLRFGAVKRQASTRISQAPVRWLAKTSDNVQGYDQTQTTLLTVSYEEKCLFDHFWQ